MNQEPRGDCFRIALNTAKALEGCCLSQSGAIKPVVLIHGSVLHSSGRRIDHAWVEIGNDEIVDRTCGIPSEIPKESYVRKTQAIEEARYSLEQALQSVVESGHW